MPQFLSVRREQDTAADVEESAPQNASPGKPTRTRTIVLLCILLVLVGLMGGFTTNYIPSESMEPTLNPGDHILTMRRWLAYPFGQEPKAGDIIVFRLATSRLSNADTATGTAPEQGPNVPKEQILIKRVIAVGGDKVRINGNSVFVNDHELHESHPLTPVSDPEGQVYLYADNMDYKVERGQLFVLGDNRDTSDDSRYWGPLETKDVIGRYARVLYNEGKYGPNEHREPQQKQ